MEVELAAASMLKVFERTRTAEGRRTGRLVIEADEELGAGVGGLVVAGPKKENSLHRECSTPRFVVGWFCS
jgi:hypothetical protein